MCDAESPRRSLPVIAAEARQALCRSCALCCDGTLFSRVPLDPDEVATMQALAFEVLDLSGKAHFAQCCAKLAERSCSVYAHRPDNCRNFHCRVLLRLDKGELQPAAAQALVNKAAALSATIQELLDSNDRSVNIWERLKALAQSENLSLDSVEFSKRHAQLGMHAALLKHVLDTEFRTKHMQALSPRMDDAAGK